MSSNGNGVGNGRRSSPGGPGSAFVGSSGMDHSEKLSSISTLPERNHPMDLFSAQTLLAFAKRNLPTTLSPPDYWKNELEYLQKEIKKKYRLADFTPRMAEQKRDYVFNLAVPTDKKGKSQSDLPFKKEEFAVFEELGKLLPKRPGFPPATKRSYPSRNGPAASQSIASSGNEATSNKRPKTSLDIILESISESDNAPEEDEHDKFIELAVDSQSGKVETKKVAVDHVLRLLFELVEQQKQEVSFVTNLVEAQGQQIQYLTTLVQAQFNGVARDLFETKHLLGQILNITIQNSVAAMPGSTTGIAAPNPMNGALATSRSTLFSPVIPTSTMNTPAILAPKAEDQGASDDLDDFLNKI